MNPLEYPTPTPTISSLRRALRRGVTCAVVLSAWLWCQPSASAQGEDSTAIAVQQYEPGPGHDDILGVQSSQILDHLAWQLGAQLNVADDVLEFRTGDTTMFKVIESQTGLDLLVSLGLFDLAELGLVLPITPYRTNGDPPDGAALDDLSTAALGDLRLVAKGRIPGLPDSLHVALAAALTLPTGKDSDFYGESTVSVEPRLLAEYRKPDGVAVAANLGFRLRDEKQFANLTYGNELTYGLGVRLPFEVAGLELAGISTLVGSLSTDGGSSEERPLELLAGLEFEVIDGLVLALAAGPGLSKGYGTPDVRVVAGFRFQQKPAEKPACRHGAEDLDGHEDDDGCADPDNDGDGVNDDIDVCPNEPGVASDDDLTGCPRNPVGQGAGQPGDAGPVDPAIGEPLAPLQPALDPDNDGLAGEDDSCPDQPEDVDQFEDFDGCPEDDNDSDGIKDADDRCPLQAEVINGIDDDDGCPDKGKSGVVLDGSSILILDKVYFDTNKTTIKQSSFPILDQVAATLRANAQITRLRVEGHTDSRGRADYNLQLSEGRAAAVRQYLIDKGIAAERLVSQGFGETQLIDTRKTRAAHDKNRRVIFQILEINGQPVPPAADSGSPPG